MSVIPNKWVQKEKKKKAPETAPSFGSIPDDTWIPVKSGTPEKRSTTYAKSTMHKTLRGVRK